VNFNGLTVIGRTTPILSVADITAGSTVVISLVSVVPDTYSILDGGHKVIFGGV
jgi:hypothetical protein